MRAVDKDRERMVAAIHDLQSQVDALQSKSDVTAHSGEHENTRLVLAIRDLEAQVEDLNKRVVEEREQASKLAGEVDETNSALDEVRLGMEKEMELRKEAEQETQMLQKMFEDEVSQWRAKEVEWERERASLRENGYSSFLFSLQLHIHRKKVRNF
jgi:methyl-accepting chemotaxis protein